MRGSWLVCAALALASCPRAAAAQDDREREEARRAFVEGARAVEEHRLADAIGPFERSYALSRNPAALFNVVYSLFGVGRYLEALDAADRMLEAHPDLAADLRARVSDLRARARARLARLVLIGLDEGDVARVDGRLVAPEDDPPSVRVDPGPHELWAEREGSSRYEWRGELAEGEVRPIELTFEPLSAGDDAPIAWTLGGVGAALLIAAVVIGAVVADAEANLRPMHDRVLRP